MKESRNCTYLYTIQANMSLLHISKQQQRVLLTRFWILSLLFRHLKTSSTWPLLEILNPRQLIQKIFRNFSFHRYLFSTKCFILDESFRNRLVSSPKILKWTIGWVFQVKMASTYPSFYFSLYLRLQNSWPTKESNKSCSLREMNRLYFL